MSLKQKIREKMIKIEKLPCPEEILSMTKKQFCEDYNREIQEVCGLLDAAIVDIEAKAFRKGVVYWENVVILDDVRKILLGGENQQ